MMGGTTKHVGTPILSTLFVRLHPTNCHGGRRQRRAMALLLQADSADTVIMIARAAVLRAQVGVISGVDIGMLMKCGAADGVKVGGLSGHAMHRKDVEPVCTV